MMDIRQAIAHLRGGTWEAAHLIVQDDSTPFGAWAHGIVHMLEGDMANAGYWYDRAGRKLPAMKDAGEEIEALAAASGQSGSEGCQDHDSDEEGGDHGQ